jgi:hypothetical protein
MPFWSLWAGCWYHTLAICPIRFVRVARDSDTTPFRETGGVAVKLLPLLADIRQRRLTG